MQRGRLGYGRKHRFLHSGPDAPALGPTGPLTCSRSPHYYFLNTLLISSGLHCSVYPCLWVLGVEPNVLGHLGTNKAGHGLGSSK